MIETATIFGPATIVSKDNPVQVRLMDQSSGRARLALAVDYQPETGDEVLVIGEDPQDLYVIGVLKGKGTTTLAVAGDLHLESRKGKIQIQAPGGVQIGSEGPLELSSPHVNIQAGKLEMTSQRLIQRSQDVYQWFSGLLQTRAKSVRTWVSDVFHVKSRRAIVKGARHVKIAGKRIDLG